MSEEKPKRGQRGKKKEFFDKKNIEKVFQLAQRGLIDQEIYEFLGISKNCFYQNLKKKPELKEALEKGREKSVDSVENALFKIAIGYEYEEIHKTVKQVDGKDTKEIKTVKKQVKPEVAAIIFILTNRRPEKWKNKNFNEHDGKIDLITHAATEINFLEVDEETIRKEKNENEE